MAMQLYTKDSQPITVADAVLDAIAKLVQEQQDIHIRNVLARVKELGYHYIVDGKPWTDYLDITVSQKLAELAKVSILVRGPMIRVRYPNGALRSIRKYEVA